MPTAPECKSLGRHCRSLRITLRMAELDDDDAPFRDAIGTWLLGHTENIDFGEPRIAKRRALVDATLHADCRYFKATSQGARCTAHGFSGSVPVVRRNRPAPFIQDGTVRLLQDGRTQTLALPVRPKPPRSLPMLDTNPCAGAPCRTGDNVQGAACCRDLTLDVVLPAYDMHAEDLLAARKTPYVCKVTRMTEDVVECEVISACGYLEANGESCGLHDRLRPDGSPAKPSVCSEWPDLDPGDTGHPGCRLIATA